jgi:2-dehydropantoate 2-reductase
MKILVLGAGALGGYYGSRLIEVGADVTFLVRPARANLLNEQGLTVRSPLGNFTGKVNVVFANDAPQTYDVILLTCKAYDLEDASKSIAPAMNEHSVIVPLLNGLSAYDSLDQRFGARRVLGGVSYIATTLTESGEIAHLSPFDKLSVGARQPEQIPQAEAFYDLLSKTKGTRTLSDQISQELWEKWVMICAGAAATCLMRSTIGDILATDDGTPIVKSIFDECLAVARKAGHEPRSDAQKSATTTLLDPNSKWAASMMRDIAANAPRIEADAILGDMIRRGKQYAVDTPLLKVAYTHLQAYQVRHLSS